MVVKSITGAVSPQPRFVANYSPSVAMELTLSKEITCNNKDRDSRQTNMSPEHYF